MVNFRYDPRESNISHPEPEDNTIPLLTREEVDNMLNKAIELNRLETAKQDKALRVFDVTLITMIIAVILLVGWALTKLC